MLHWFQKSIITEESADWLHECADWIIQQFDPQAFKEKTPLVTPDAHYFPKQVSSPQEMAEYILQRVTEIAGVSHLPWQLLPANQCSAITPPLLALDTKQRHVSATEIAPLAAADSHLEIPFIPQQIKKPQDLVASTANQCAQHILWQSQQIPPGGMPFFAQASELLAVFFGFGIILANSAYTFRGSCAKCYDALANRQANLSENETLYALALFATIKAIPARQVTPHLKSHLRNTYKVALKQIQRRQSISDGG